LIFEETYPPLLSQSTGSLGWTFAFSDSPPFQLTFGAGAHDYYFVLLSKNDNSTIDFAGFPVLTQGAIWKFVHLDAAGLGRVTVPAPLSPSLVGGAYSFQIVAADETTGAILGTSNVTTTWVIF